MSTTSFTNERLDDSDTPPHGVPPVTRAAVAGPPPPDAPAGLSEPADLDGVPASRQHQEGEEDWDRRAWSRLHRRRQTRRRRRVVVCLLVVVLVLAGAVAWYEIEANPLGAQGSPVLVDVHSGEPMSAIDSSLADKQVIGTSVAFSVWSFVHGVPTVRPGIYRLHRNLSFSAAKSALEAGPNVSELTVFPGTTISEVASQLSSLPGNLPGAFADAGAAGGVSSPYEARAGGALEGLIGTGTYEIEPGETGRQLLQQMVDRFETQARTAGLTPSTTVDGLDAYQLVTLASIAQKEGYFVRYMGDVARVIFNRLSSGMRLDMTSTVLYSFGKDGGPVTPQEEEVTTPYNTYLHAGLTPTPICTPSVQALRAAVHPPPGSWLYFELTTAHNGIMKFASTFTGQLALEHEAAVNAARHPQNGSSPGTST